MCAISNYQPCSHRCSCEHILRTRQYSRVLTNRPPFFHPHRTYRLLGLVSFGECGDVNHPIVYTRARYYHDWLLTAMASTPDPSQGWGEWSAWTVCSKLYV